MADGISQVMARLRTDAFLVPAPDGARFLTDRGAESLSGAGIHRWISVLAPYLDGTTPLSGLVGRLPLAQREMVERIVAALLDRGLVRDGGEPTRCAETGYLDAFVPDVDSAFAAYRRATTLAVGSGPVLAELLRTLPLSGAAAARRVPAGPDETGIEALRAALGGGADLVVHVPDAPDDPQPEAVDRLCLAAGVPVVRAVRRGGELWFHAGSGGAAGLRRLDRWSRGTASPGTAAELPPEVVALAAGRLGTAALRLLTGVAGAAEVATMDCLDIATLTVTTHRFLPMPPAVAARPRARAAAARSLARKVGRLRAAPALTADGLDATGARLLDPRLGVLGELSERDFVQLPLNVAAATAAGRERPVTGAGTTVERARWRAVLAALALHGVSGADAASLAGDPVWGARLADDGARPVDPAAVFAPPGPPAGGEAAGAAAGFSWQEAVTDGLLDHCARLTAAAPGPVVRVDPATLARLGGPEAEDCLRMLRVLGLPLAVHDVTGPLRVPTLAFCSGTRTVAYASALRPAAALAAGLRAVLLDEQAGRDRRAAFAPPPVPQLGLDAVVRGEAAAPCTVPQAVAALRARGLDPVAVPLDHDPEVARIMPFVVRVVLADA